MKRSSISTHRARQLITAINSAHLDRSNYKTLQSQINELFQGYALKGMSLAQDQMIYRGRVMAGKPSSIDELKAPPAEAVKGFQRCNSPGNPMFYGGFVLGAIFAEVIGPDTSDGKIFVSRWVAPEGFFAVELLPKENQAEMDTSRTQAIVDTFIETKFVGRVHETYSNDYKVTAAIAEKALSGSLSEEANDGFPITPKEGEGLGCIIYPSVQATGRGPNVAMIPSYANRHLIPDCVEEIHFRRKSEESFEINRIDYAKPSLTDNTLVWTGKQLHWTVDSGSTATVGVEGGQYVVRDESGKTVLSP
ncbi:hypothetical protein [Ruegeria sp. Ofav3-42]|uniref:hypothetical protein n=1 Tax=Ruegeria sp. Ofav3-42 TaxID=2917759 RepID=UPI001EF5C167|nr:hypothetical protein [Ruegeria sp. Ofav3-42]MCG7518810.1 hypothetical protein [Ruegeria sp. Ofav3-42]